MAADDLHWSECAVLSSSGTRTSNANERHFHAIDNVSGGYVLIVFGYEALCAAQPDTMASTLIQCDFSCETLLHAASGVAVVATHTLESNVRRMC